MHFILNYFIGFQLKQRLERMERRVSLQKNCTNSYTGSNFQLEDFSNDMTHDTGFCADTEDSKDNIKVMGICSEDSNYPIVSNVERRNQERELSANLTEQSNTCYDNLINKQLSGECKRFTTFTMSFSIRNCQHNEKEF